MKMTLHEGAEIHLGDKLLSDMNKQAGIDLLNQIIEQIVDDGELIETVLAYLIATHYEPDRFIDDETAEYDTNKLDLLS